MTTIPALYKITTGTYSEFEARNFTYPQGVLTYITSGAHAGRMKVGDGLSGWNSRPFLVPQATETLLGLLKSSTTRLYGHINANGLLSINGLEAELETINSKDLSQDDEISAIKQQLAGMSGTIIYIGSFDKYTSELKGMSAADRHALLTDRAVELRGQVIDGYTLQDLGQIDEAGRFHYWQYQPDGTWFDLGERGEVSQATDTDLGIVMGSAAQYKIHIEPDGTMSVNGLAAKLEELDDKDGELGADIEALEERLETFETSQAEVNGKVEDEIEGIKEAAETLAYNVDNFKTAQEADNEAQAEATVAAQADIDAHKANASNPHGVTKAQVELGNVNNTADMDKPVSTAQAEAIATAERKAENAQAAAEKRVSKAIFAGSNNALVADMAVMPEAGSLANIRKTLKNVDSGGTYDIDVHVTSEDGTLEAQISKTDDKNYTLNLEAVKLKDFDKKFAKDTSNYVVGDFTYTPTDNKTVRLKKTAVSVDGAGTTQVYEGGLKLGENLKLVPKTETEFELNIDDEISARNEAIAEAVANIGLGGGADMGGIEDALPPLLADRDGRLVAARGGTLIELHAHEPWSVFLPLLADRDGILVAARGGTLIELHRPESVPIP